MPAIREITEKAKKELVALSGFTSPSAVGFKKKGEGWLVTIQITEKKSIPEGMDVLGVYEVEADQKGNILGYERKEIRRRGDVAEREGG